MILTVTRGDRGSDTMPVWNGRQWYNHHLNTSLSDVNIPSIGKNFIAVFMSLLFSLLMAFIVLMDGENIQLGCPVRSCPLDRLVSYCMF